MAPPPGADVAVTLVSRDDVWFRLSANALKAASGVFRTTLSLPQPQGTNMGEAIIDSLDEVATTIEGLLRIITAKEVPLLDTIEAIEPLLLAAVKWDMPGPLSILRILLIKDPSFSSAHPIRLYWLGCHLSWLDLAQVASKYSCNLDIYYRPHLQSLLTRLTSEDLLRLVTFHRTRRDCMKTFLEGGTLASSNCNFGSRTIVATAQFRDFELRILELMDTIPPGPPLVESTLRDVIVTSTLDTTQCQYPGLTACRGCHCSVPSVMRMMVAQWRILPQTI